MNETDNHNEKVMAIRHEHFFSEAVISNYHLQSPLVHCIFLSVFKRIVDLRSYLSWEQEHYRIRF